MQEQVDSTQKRKFQNFVLINKFLFDNLLSSFDNYSDK